MASHPLATSTRNYMILTGDATSTRRARHAYSHASRARLVQQPLTLAHALSASQEGRLVSAATPRARTTHMYRRKSLVS